MDIAAEVLSDGIGCEYFCVEEVYGSCTELRAFFEDRGQGYVLRVPKTFRLTLASGQRLTCADAASLLAGTRQGEVRSAGKGSTGERWYAWSWLATASPQHCLLIRRHLRTGELPGSPGALLHRGPLRTAHATRRGTRPKQAAWAGSGAWLSSTVPACCPGGLPPSLAGGVYEVRPVAACGGSWLAAHE